MPINIPQIEETLKEFKQAMKIRDKANKDLAEKADFLIEARHQLRMDGGWALADKIRDSLGVERIYFEDYPKATIVRKDKYKYREFFVEE